MTSASFNVSGQATVQGATVPFYDPVLGISNYLATTWLAYLTGQIKSPTLPSLFLGVFNSIPTLTGPSTEPTAGSYSRVSIAGSLVVGRATTESTTLFFNFIPSWVRPGMVLQDFTNPMGIPPGTMVLTVNPDNSLTVSNSCLTEIEDIITLTDFVSIDDDNWINLSTSISFNSSGGTAWGGLVAWGLFDSALAGNLLFWDYLGRGSWQNFTCSAAGIIVCPLHGFSPGDLVAVSTKAGGTLPSPTVQWGGGELMVETTPDINTLTLVGISPSTSGNGQIRQITPITLGLNSILSFPAGGLSLQLS